MDPTTLLNSEIPAARGELQKSYQNLPPLAAHIRSKYGQAQSAAERAAAFQEARQFATQALASVAYQVNIAATSITRLLDVQTIGLKNLDAQLAPPHAAVNMYEEQLARKSIAQLTKPRNMARSRKIAKLNENPPPVRYQRKPITFDLLDKVGHGVPEAQGAHTPAHVPINTGTVMEPRRMTTTARPPSTMGDIYGNIGDIYGSVATGPVTAAAPPSLPSGGGDIYETVGAVRNFRTPAAPQAPSAPYVPAPTMAPPAGPPPPAGGPPSSRPPGPPAGQPPGPPPGQPPGPPSGPPPQAPAFAPPAAAAPPPPAQQSLPMGCISQGRALYDYAATMEDELSFSENEIIDIIAKNDDGWFEGVVGDRRGLFPGNYIEEFGGDAEC